MAMGEMQKFGANGTPLDFNDLAAAFLEGRNERTRAAYRLDLIAFAAFVGVPDASRAAQELLARGPGAANRLVLAYRARMLEQKLAPATINRRLAALRSIVKLARTFGMVAWALEIPGLRSAPYRDTRGPGMAGVRAMLQAAALDRTPKGLRDHALLRLLFDLALRRGEAAGLDLADLDLKAGTLAVLGKGRSEKARLTLPEPTRAALAAWVGVRGLEAGPLFLNADRARKGGRLTGRSVARIVAELGASAGLTVRPHGLRHAAITAALDLTNGDVRSAAKFSRHADVRTLTLYDDARQDLAGAVAARVAGLA